MGGEDEGECVELVVDGGGDADIEGRGVVIIDL